MRLVCLSSCDREPPDFSKKALQEILVQVPKTFPVLLLLL